MNNNIINLGYEIFFYNTLGLMDSVVVRMIKDLLEIGEYYKEVKVFRNDSRYIGCPLVVSFDNKLFVDIRLDNRYGMKNKNIYNSIYSFVTIFDNSYGVEYNDYMYVRLDFSKNFGSKICDRFVFSNFDSNYKGIQIFFFDYYEVYKNFSFYDLSQNSRKNFWLFILNSMSFEKFEKVIVYLLSVEEREELFSLIDSFNKNIGKELQSIIEKEDNYCCVYDEYYRDKIINNLLLKGVDKDIIASVFEISLFELEGISNLCYK